MDVYFPNSLRLPIKIGIEKGAVKFIKFSSFDKRAIGSISDPCALGAIKELEEYFSGRLKKFHTKISPDGTPFQKKVWRELAKVEYGETITYGELAKRIGEPKSCRAVAGALHKNPIAIMLPCHRIVAANGKLGGFAGGIAVKKFLIDLEKSATEY